MFERPLFMFSMNGRNDYTIKPVSLSINSLVPTRSCCSSLRHLNHGAQIHVSSLKLEGLFLLVINGSMSLPWNTISVPGQRKSNMWIIKSVKPSQTHTIKKKKKTLANLQQSVLHVSNISSGTDSCWHDEKHFLHNKWQEVIKLPPPSPTH